MSEEALPNLLFICGTPRSGVEIMLDFLSAPKTAGWIPEQLADNPDTLRYARKIHPQNWPILGEFYLERRYNWKSVANPAPADEFLNHYLSDFNLAQREYIIPGPEHVKEGEADALKTAIGTIADLERKDNLVLGYYGFPRIRMLRSIFPNAKFMQCIRDPRSLTFRMVRRDEQNGNEFYNLREKILPRMPQVLQERFEELGDIPLVFGGIYTRWMHEVYKEEMGELPPGDKLEMSYSDMLSRPPYSCKRAMKFAGYPYNKRFQYYLKFHGIHASNQRTNRNLNEEESELLAKAIAPVPEA